MITDIIRSIHSRCELLCEDIEVIEEEGNRWSVLLMEETGIPRENHPSVASN
jgi:hypothetical protein